MTYILNTEWCAQLLENQPLCVIDGGARGSVFPPLSLVNPKILNVIRFDPDPEAHFSDFENSIIIHKGLWETEATIPFYITKSPTASSVYPVDFRVVKQFLRDKKKLEWRETDKVIQVDAISIDYAIKNNLIPEIDFIKLDIHGSEYQALKGANKALENVLGVHVETWSVPYYKGQKTHSATALLLEEKAFILCELLKYGGEKRNTSTTNFSKQQPISYDCLFFKDLIDNDITYSKTKAVKTIGLAELYGHFGHAAQLNNYFLDKGLFDQELHQKIHQNLISHTDWKTKYLQKIIDLLSRKISKLG